MVHGEHAPRIIDEQQELASLIALGDIGPMMMPESTMRKPAPQDVFLVFHQSCQVSASCLQTPRTYVPVLGPDVAPAVSNILCPHAGCIRGDRRGREQGVVLLASPLTGA